MLRGVDTTPLRWFHTWRVTHTSSTPQVDTTVPPTLASIIGKASDDPVTLQKYATIVEIIVSETRSTARTAAVRTGSGMRRRPTGSSTHSSRPGRRVPAVPMVTSPTPRGRAHPFLAGPDSSVTARI